MLGVILRWYWNILEGDHINNFKMMIWFEVDEKWPNYRDMAGWYLMSHKYHLVLYFWWGGDDNNGRGERLQRGRGVRTQWSKKRAIHATVLLAGWSVVYNPMATGAVILWTMPYTPHHPHMWVKQIGYFTHLLFLSPVESGMMFFSSHTVVDLQFNDKKMSAVFLCCAVSFYLSFFSGPQRFVWLFLIPLLIS